MEQKTFSLFAADWIKGLIVAIISAVVVTIYGLTQAPDFSLAMINWGMVGTTAFSAFIGYIAKNLLSSSKGTYEEKVVGIPLPPPVSNE